MHRFRRLLLFSLVALMLGSGLAVTTPLSRPVAASTVSAYCIGPVEQELLSLINDYRKQNGLGQLAASQTLGAAAQHHALDMVGTSTLSHTLSDGTTWSENIADHGYPYSGRGENLAWEYSTAEIAFSAWKGSPTHNANMLSSGFKAIGVSHLYDPDAHVRRVWVTTFGSQLDTPAIVCGSSATSTPVSVAPTATKTATPKPASTNTVTPKPTNTPAPASTNTQAPPPTATSAPVQVAAYVSNMSGKASSRKNSSSVSVTVAVQDSKGQKVSGATVTMTLTAPDGTSTTLTVTTNGRGQGSWSGKVTQGSGTYTATVTNVVAAGRVYDPSLNAANSVAMAVK